MLKPGSFDGAAEDGDWLPAEGAATTGGAREAEGVTPAGGASDLTDDAARFEVARVEGVCEAGPAVTVLMMVSVTVTTLSSSGLESPGFDDGAAPGRWVSVGIAGLSEAPGALEEGVGA
jgi:hypothetical protein